MADFRASFARDAGWDDTALLFLSDHGEQFREHGGLYHNHSLFDEELRVPGWIVADPAALDAAQRAALASLRGPAHVHAGRPRDRRGPAGRGRCARDPPLRGARDRASLLRERPAARGRRCSWPRRRACGSRTTPASAPRPASASSSARPARGPASTPPAIRTSTRPCSAPRATISAPPSRRCSSARRAERRGPPLLRLRLPEVAERPEAVRRPGPSSPARGSPRSGRAPRRPSARAPKTHAPLADLEDLDLELRADRERLAQIRAARDARVSATGKSPRPARPFVPSIWTNRP